MNQIKKHVILVLYLVINLLFVDKYAARITDYHLLVSVAYLLGASVLILLIEKKAHAFVHSAQWLIGIGLLFLCAGVGLQYAIDPFSLQVDRWSALHNFLTGMLSGEYPYGYPTHLGGYGSPFPVWQMFHLPFCLLGNVGLSIFVVTVAFIVTIYFCRSSKAALVATILLCVSPAFWYEIAVRSDLVTNMLLVAIIAEWLVCKQIKLTPYIIPIGVLSGLILSTRFIAIIPICVIYGYEFLKMGWKKQLVFLFTTLGTFGLTFLPFILWDGSTLLFFEYNPFVLQTRQGSWVVLLLFAIIAIAITIYQKGSIKHRTAYTGLLLTTLVTMAFIEKMYQQNLWKDLYSSAFDITYLSTALPFYIEFLAHSLSLGKE